MRYAVTLALLLICLSTQGCALIFERDNRTVERSHP